MGQAFVSGAVPSVAPCGAHHSLCAHSARLAQQQRPGRDPRVRHRRLVTTDDRVLGHTARKTFALALARRARRDRASRPIQSGTTGQPVLVPETLFPLASSDAPDRFRPPTCAAPGLCGNRRPSYHRRLTAHHLHRTASRHGSRYEQRQRTRNVAHRHRQRPRRFAVGGGRHSSSRQPQPFGAVLRHGRMFHPLT